MKATILQILGAGLVSAGAAVIYPPLGLIIAGVAALIFGIAMERS